MSKFKAILGLAGLSAALSGGHLLLLLSLLVAPG